ncbi:MAG: hypothetical protein IKL34_00605 [Alistipes sp.]|nr:hypothetical protein [Alistipes sp.]
MPKNDICEALYALPDVKIIKRRKPLTTPILLLIAGFALIAINSVINSTIETSNIKSALVLAAALLVIVGIVVIMIRISGNDDVPYHVDDKCYLQRKELRFEKNKRAYIAQLINKADFATLLSLKQDGVSAVTVSVYSSPKSGFCACQAFEYVELERRPIGKMVYKH